MGQGSGQSEGEGGEESAGIPDAHGKNRALVESKRVVSKEVKKIERLTARLGLLKQEEPQLRAKQFTGSGNVFITFNTEEDALTFRMEHKAGKVTDPELQVHKRPLSQTSVELH